MNWVKVGYLNTKSGLVWLSDPYAVLHQNHAMQPELGLNYNNFIDYLEMKEKGAGVRGHAQFTGADGTGLGVCIQANTDVKALDVWVRKDDEGNVLEIRVICDNSQPI